MCSNDEYVYFIKLEEFPAIKTKLYFDIDMEQYNVEVDGFITLVSNQLMEVSDYIDVLFKDKEYQNKEVMDAIKNSLEVADYE